MNRWVPSLFPPYRTPRPSLYCSPCSSPAPHCSLMLDCIISHPNRASGFCHIMSSSLSISLFVSSKSRRHEEREMREKDGGRTTKRQMNITVRAITHTLSISLSLHAGNNNKDQVFHFFLSTFKMDLSYLSVCSCVTGQGGGQKGVAPKGPFLSLPLCHHSYNFISVVFSSPDGRLIDVQLEIHR